ncbi:MAG: ABC transporter ATP-binding protein [Lachnospiraceae bacterium]|nr:ABC transporter ATP-binding protein [Lachnospiraceae bacterium]
MKQIFSCLKPYAGRMTVGFVIKVAATIVELLIPWALSVMIDDIIPLSNVGIIFAWGLVMILFAVLALVGNIVANRMASLVARNTTERIRLQLYSRISFLSARQQEAFTMPSLISRATSDTYNIHQMLGMMQRLGVRQPIMLIGGLAVTLTMDASLTMIMLAMIPPMGVLVYLFSSRGIPMYGRVQEALDRFIRLVREDTAGVRVIKALSKTDTERKKFASINKEVVDKEWKAGMVMGAMNPVMSFFLNLGMVLVIYYGAVRVNSGLTKPGVIMAFMSYVTIILNSILFMSRMFAIFSKASASAKRITEVLNTPEDLMIEERPGVDHSAHIVFDQVSFGYEGSEHSLKNISFEVERGKTLGIIGATGSGKSTIINMLMRYYDPQEGAVFVNGMDVRAYSGKNLKTMFGVAFQNDVIFHDTIRENISFGRNLSDEEILKAAKAAQAMEFIEEKGLDFMLAIRGMNVSGGQKQRLLISRALAGNPQILILDDSSSALDYATDARLRQAIRREYSDITTIIVAQRISSIMHADRILVLEDGEIIGDGVHEQLMETCDVYREISDSQMGGGALGE